MEDFLEGRHADSRARGGGRDDFNLCESDGRVWSHFHAGREYSWKDGDNLTAGVWVVIVMALAFVIVCVMNLIVGKQLKHVKRW